MRAISIRIKGSISKVMVNNKALYSTLSECDRYQQKKVMVGTPQKVVPRYKIKIKITLQFISILILRFPFEVSV